MSQLTGIPVGASGFIEPKRERVSGLWIILGLFILGVVTVSPLEGWNYVVKGLGVFLALVYLIETLRGRMRIAPEVVLYIAWLTVSLAGVFEHPSTELFFYVWTTCFQIWVLLVIVSGFTAGRKALSLNFAVFLLAAFILGAHSYATGEYQAAEAGTGVRLTGWSRNPNAFGWIMLLATVALAYFWMLPTRAKWLKYGFLLAGFAAAGLSELFSFSRTHIAGMAFFFLAWIWLCYRKTLRRSIMVTLGVVGLLVVAGYLGFLLFEQAGGLLRYTQVVDTLSGRATGGSAYIRLQNFKVGWQLLMDHPLTGVGLSGFLLRVPYRLMAHSEYVEIAVDTGVPGFLLYFGILWVLWRRAGKLARQSDSAFVVQVANLTRAAVLMVLLTDLGRWNYNDKSAWIILGSLIGFTNAAWHEHLALKAAPAGEDSAAAVLSPRPAVGTLP